MAHRRDMFLPQLTVHFNGIAANQRICAGGVGLHLCIIMTGAQTLLLTARHWTLELGPMFTICPNEHCLSGLRIH